MEASAHARPLSPADGKVDPRKGGYTKGRDGGVCERASIDPKVM